MEAPGATREAEGAASRQLVAAVPASTLLVTLAVVSACDAGSPAGPTFDARTFDATAEQAAGGVDATVVSEAETGTVGGPSTLCPDGMAASYQSIFSRMLATSGCGTGEPYDCHSSTGALPQAEGGTGSLLDFSLDAATVYEELLGADGTGHPAENIDGDAGGVLLRVAPGDAGASLLYIKLALPTLSDLRYGRAMPPTQVVCSPALDAVEMWIDQGAAK